MQTKARANSVITHAVRDGGMVLVWQVTGCPEITLDKRTIAEANRTRFETHGIFQRVNDAAALSRNTADGKPASPQAKYEAMARVVAHYASGNESWAMERTGPSGPGLDGIALAAVAEATGKTIDAVRELVAAGATKHGVGQPAYLANLCTSERVIPILTRMRAAGGVDPNAELEAMMKRMDEEPTGE